MISVFWYICILLFCIWDICVLYLCMFCGVSGIVVFWHVLLFSNTFFAFGVMFIILLLLCVVVFGVCGGMFLYFFHVFGFIVFCLNFCMFVVFGSICIITVVPLNFVFFAYCIFVLFAFQNFCVLAHLGSIVFCIALYVFVCVVFCVWGRLVCLYFGSVWLFLIFCYFVFCNIAFMFLVFIDFFMHFSNSVYILCFTLAKLYFGVFLLYFMFDILYCVILYFVHLVSRVFYYFVLCTFGM